VAPKLGKKFVKESLETGREAEERLKFRLVPAKWQVFFERICWRTERVPTPARPPCGYSASPPGMYQRGGRAPMGAGSINF
jgi:hypothetical protein